MQLLELRHAQTNILIGLNRLKERELLMFENFKIFGNKISSVESKILVQNFSNLSIFADGFSEISKLTHYLKR